MKLRTELTLNKIDDIAYNHSIVFLGSCFAKNIGEKFKNCFFSAVINPFGTLYHPHAIAQLLNQLERPGEDWALFENQQIWRSWYTHSDISSLSKSELVYLIDDKRKKMINQLQSANHIFITLGSAFQYMHKATNLAVANCHKIPQKEFTQQLTSIPELTASVLDIIRHIKSYNPACKITLTVSPVRHISHGLISNNRSKARLIESVHSAVESGSANYFPAYELVMDDLRDYRFMRSNLTHPNELAVNYIWEKMIDAYLSETTQQQMKQVEKVVAALNNRPFQPNSKAHQEFLKQTEIKRKKLEQELNIKIKGI